LTFLDSSLGIFACDPVWPNNLQHGFIFQSQMFTSLAFACVTVVFELGLVVVLNVWHYLLLGTKHCVERRS